MNILCCIKMPPDYLQKPRLKPIPGHKSSHVELQTTDTVLRLLND